MAYYKDERELFTNTPKHVEKVELRDYYGITEEARTVFVKYLLDMKMTEALAAKAGKDEKANRITEWFSKFEKILQEIYMDESIKLDFDEETFKFSIMQDGKEPFGFNELSRGFSAILDIVIDLMLRMEKHMKKAFCYDIPGIVLIDEIETHLHLELQKKILDYLTGLFLNIQFIVSTHSPFALNSIKNATIYDLEKRVTVQDSAYVAAEFCGKNVIYPFDNIISSDCRNGDHEHDFDAVIENVLENPLTFSVEQYKEDYSHQELEVLDCLQRSLKLVNERKSPLSREEK